ncbi:hypothetical protein K2Z84_08465 [Candidatus Binatia bacterium]|nr:hypothetical protein [Candidatus Binatia bacterium]
MTPKQVERLDEAPAYHAEIGVDLPLDRWIGFAVKVLRDAGIETYESCEGGKGHAFPEPTIRFHGTSTTGFHAFNIAMEHALPVYAVRRAWSVTDGELTGPNWEMVFHPRRTLVRRQQQAERAGLMGAPPKRRPHRVIGQPSR